MSGDRAAVLRESLAEIEGAIRVCEEILAGEEDEVFVFGTCDPLRLHRFASGAVVNEPWEAEIVLDMLRKLRAATAERLANLK
jgi:hypothetical protein